MKKLSQKAFHVRQFVKNLQVESEVYNTREEAEQAVSAYMSKNTSDVLYQERCYIRYFLQKHDEENWSKDELGNYSYNGNDPAALQEAQKLNEHAHPEYYACIVETDEIQEGYKVTPYNGGWYKGRSVFWFDNEKSANNFLRANRYYIDPDNGQRVDMWFNVIKYKEYVKNCISSYDGEPYASVIRREETIVDLD